MNTIHLNQLLDLSLFYKIDINLYPVFISIYEQQNISKAAQTLNVSQSAVSHALNRLRQLLQDDLFIRVSGRMLPTPFAEHIYPNIQQALIAIQMLSLQKQQFDVHQIKQLKIAMHDEVEPMILPKIMEHFQRLNLDIQFISVKLDRKNSVSDLMTQQIDFVIDLEHTVSEQIQYQNLVQDRFMVCTAQTKMNEKVYLASPHIGVSSRRIGILVEDVYLQKKQLHRELFLRCQNYSTALQILQQYPNAILTIPQSILAHLNIPITLSIFESPVDLPILNIGLYWYKNLDLNLRHQFLRSEIIKNFT